MVSKHHIHWVDECDSTNAAIAKDARHGYVLAARAQTAGRGQRGSAWESAPSLNLTFSLVLRPLNLSARSQMAITMAVTTAICDALAPYYDCQIKWPNDIYVDGDRKLAGLLIENELSAGRVRRSVVGIGLNVNQTVFTSGAPNPVSLSQLTGRSYDLGALLERIVAEILRHDISDEAVEALRAEYMQRLWRREGSHRWRDTATGEEFLASIADVRDNGLLKLIDTDGRRRYFLFKEVQPILSGGLVSPTDQ